MSKQTETSDVLASIYSTLSDAAPVADRCLVDGAKRFIRLAIEAEEVSSRALRAGTEAAEIEMHAALERAQQAAVSVLNARASTLVGLIAKSAVSVWCTGSEMMGGTVTQERINDQTAAQSIVRDLVTGSILRLDGRENRPGPSRKHRSARTADGRKNIVSPELCADLRR